MRICNVLLNFFVSVYTVDRSVDLERKGGDLIQSYDKNPYTQRKLQKAK